MKQVQSSPDIRSLVALAFLLLSACSGGTTKAPAKTSAEITNQGGKVESTDGATVQVAAGALSSSVTVSIAAVDAPVALPATAASKVFEFTPHGTQFAIPARVSLRYSAKGTSLKVLRLADAQATTWQPVGGATFSGGVATFDTPSFSYYAVVEDYTCTASTEGASACGTGCANGSFCSTATQCVEVSSTKLCENNTLYVINGQLPDLSVVSSEQTSDPKFAAEIAGAIGTQCALTPTTVSQADAGILDACTDAPLLGSGTTIVLVGGGFSQRLARYVDASLAPVTLSTDSATSHYVFKSRMGATLVDFDPAVLSPSHDYFVVSLMADPARGALILHVYGVGWEGTPAATAYLKDKVLPEMFAGSRGWQRYLLVEWTDNGDGTKGAGDTYQIVAQDIP